MFEVKLVKLTEHRDAFLDLFRSSFGHTMTVKLWEWKYLMNPFANTSPDLVVAMIDNKIIGARPFLFAEMWINGNKVKIAQPTDTMVHPAYRHVGIFRQMNKFAIEYYKKQGYLLFCNVPGPMSLAGYTKQGWVPVSTIDTLFYLITSKHIFSKKLKSNHFGKFVGFFWDLLLKKNRLSTPNSNDYQIKVFEQFNDTLQIDSLRDPSKINIVRSEKYLRWRFDQHPEYDYKYLVIMNDDQPLGYAVISTKKQLNGIIQGRIVDYLIKNDDLTCFNSLMYYCLTELKKLNCDIVYFGVFNQPILGELLLKNYHFKLSSKFPYNMLIRKGYFAVRVLEENLAEKKDIYNKTKWHITYIFQDVT